MTASVQFKSLRNMQIGPMAENINFNGQIFQNGTKFGARMDWEGLRNTDINIYAKNITEKIIALSNDCIPNRNVLLPPKTGGQL